MFQEIQNHIMANGQNMQNKQSHLPIQLTPSMFLLSLYIYLIHYAYILNLPM